MSMKLLGNLNDPPIGALIVAELILLEEKAKIDVTLSSFWKSSSNVQLIAQDGNIVCESSNEVGRYIARTVNAELYGGSDIVERTEVDHWISFSIGPLKSQKSINDSLNYLDDVLKPKTWLVAKRLTLADIYVFASLVDHRPLETDGKYSNINRWYKHMLSLAAVQKVLASVPKNRVPGANKATKSAGRQEGKDAKRPCGTGNRKQEGKFIELDGAEMGKVVVRFPPEASGYLHIGHAKAALLNQYYAEAFDGQLIMRFDDTNPAKENVEFEQAILQDLEMLQIKPHRFTHSSDYFDLMLSYCDKLIKEGKAFVDDTPALEMKEQREQRLPSANRDNSVEKNLQLWEEMKNGTDRGQECCVRAKIDFQSTNGCMRDPTIYRCKPEPHPRTGSKYKVYPTYDFACPIVDAVEGVTHTLRTTEYHDRDVQFYWFIDALDLRRPHIWEYSRLNMTNTVLSKRRLTWLVNEGFVDGWDDPRFPTVRGILRRGMTVDGLKQFIIAQGSSRSVVFMEWDKIWSFNKKVIDPIAIRYTALNDADIVTISVENAKDEWLTVQNHPKDPAKGTKQVRVGPRLIIERCDAETLVEGQNATFINWGNLLIVKISKENGIITGVKAKVNIENRDFKNTVKLTWLSVKEDNDAKTEDLVPCYAVFFEHIISKAVLGKDEEFKDFVAKDTRKEVKLLGESELKRVKKGEIIQLQRKGFFRCDVPYEPISPFSSREQPLVLFHIPDGHSTAQTTTTTAATTEIATKLKKAKTNDKDLSSLHEKIAVQGNKVRDAKTAKAEKSVIDAEVKILLSLKAEYKAIAGTDWKPDAVPTKVDNSTAISGTDPQALSIKVQQQGDKVRQLKTEKADKKVIEQEVKNLLSLKAEYKSATGKDWKPGDVPQSDVTPVPQLGADALSVKIQQQGDKVRQLKTEKADKKVVEQEVKNLLSLKADYKSATGKDWKPAEVSPTKATTAAPQLDADALSAKVQQQGDKVRQLKTEKADKKVVEQEVKNLLSLKADYKSATGKDWKPAEVSPTKATTAAPQLDADALSAKVQQQGDKVRQLKTEKADKKVVEQEVKNLLSLKADYKSATGKDWKPAEVPPTTATTAAPQLDADALSAKVQQQGDKVRQLKTEKADKKVIDQEVKNLLSLKADYKSATGKDWKPTEVPQTTATPTTTAAPQLDAVVLFTKIQQQGDRVRQLKAEKASKKDIDQEVKNLLSLKADYKSATGMDWKPTDIPQNNAPVAALEPNADALSAKVQQQGDRVRQLKTQKAVKEVIEQEVKILLSLKAEYKSATGKDWKPESVPQKPIVPEAPVIDAQSLSAKVQQQGDKVRQLKTQKADKKIIDQEVKALLALKAEYKNVSGEDWKPSTDTKSTISEDHLTKPNKLSNTILKQGSKVKKLKYNRANECVIDEAVSVLRNLKRKYKIITGHNWKPPRWWFQRARNSNEAQERTSSGSPKSSQNVTKKDKAAKDQQPSSKDADSNKTGTRLGLEAKKCEQLSDWYSQVITKGEMIEYYDVSGCYILRPWSYSIWDIIKDYIDREIKKLDVQNCYFPIFVSKAVLEREKDHIADFAPEVAWVTKSGETDLAEPIAIRPTSETVMYPAYAKWLKSHRDLPLKLNQWNNVVRWEFKHPQPFLRTREFLWQEGHSAFATKPEADEEVLTILDIYAKVYEELLAVPVVKGRKTEKEKFAGGDYTTTVEAFVSASGRAIQGATSHHLGQNFSKMFDIQVEGADESGEKTFVYQNSWGLTTRTIGVMIMVHGDDKGLVLPPKIAAVQAIIVPCGITASTTLVQRQNLLTECAKLEAELKKDGVLKIKGDYRDNYSPGWKFNHWELKGVPVRVELGFKDLEKKQVTLVRRDTGERVSADRSQVFSFVTKLLEDIQKTMFNRASIELNEHIKQTNEWHTFCTELDKKNLILAPFCGETSCEDKIKADSTREDVGEEPGAPSMGAKSLCIPFKQPETPLASLKCVHPGCTSKPKFYTLFGRSY